MEKENCVPDFEKWALYYADLGYPVFPIYPIEYVAGVMKCRCDEPECARPGHHPLIEPYPHGATTNPQRIRKWGELYPRLGIGIPTGKISGLVAVEFDWEFPLFTPEYGREISKEPHETLEEFDRRKNCDHAVNVFKDGGYYRTARIATQNKLGADDGQKRTIQFLFCYPENFRFIGEKQIEKPIATYGESSGGGIPSSDGLLFQKIIIYSDGDFIVAPPSPYTGNFCVPEPLPGLDEDNPFEHSRAWDFDRDWIYDRVGWEEGYNPSVSPGDRVYYSSSAKPDQTTLTTFGFETSIGLAVSTVLGEYFSGRGKEELQYKRGQACKAQYDRYCEYFRKHRVLELPEEIKKHALAFGCGETVIEGPKPKAQPNYDIPVSLEAINSTVGKHFPNLLPATKACLAVTAALSFYDNPQPITLILVGGSSSGKTTALMSIYPSEEALKDNFKRLDDFTPKSFVSHHATRSTEKLESTDLLPQLEDRVLITKELSTIFRGKEEEITDKFKILTPILDGKGYVSSSGTHGTRGYDRDINFNWIGATTPPSPNVYRIMNNLGTRLVFFGLDTVEVSIEELKQLILDDTSEAKKVECKNVIQNYLRDFFKRCPVRSVSLGSVKIGEAFAGSLAELLTFVIKYRAEVSIYEDNYSNIEKHRTPSPESPYRIKEILTVLCRAHALLNGKTEVGEEELEFARHIALSSAPEDRRLAVSCIVENGGICTPAQLEKSKKMARNTAKAKLRELVLLEIVEEGVAPGDENNPTAPLLYRLKNEWHRIFGLKEVPEVVQGVRCPDYAA